MPVYVPNCKHDIFVSYAHVDNEPLIGADKGWVTTLVNSLKILLGKKLGSADAFSLWMDQKLQGNSTVTADIVKQLEGTATLLLILSPAYIESQKCMLELNIFLAQLKEVNNRVFVVEHDVVEQKPAGLDDLLGYKFWLLDDYGNPRILALPKPNPEEYQYYQKLDDLSRQLADQLKSLKQEYEKSAPNNTPITDSSTINSEQTEKTIFLAEVTQDLEQQREEVKRYLEQQGVNILPNKAYSFPNIQQDLDDDLSKSSLFVQLLSDKNTHSYPLFQYERAKNANLPILQWRSPTLDTSQVVDDHNYYQLLESSSVIAIGFVEFQAMIIKQLQPPKETPKFDDVIADSLVFINAAPEDIELAHKIRDFLDEHGIGYSMPLEDFTGVKASEIRQYLEQNLISCDAVLLLYDNTSVYWVNEQLLYCRRMQGRRDQPLKLIAVYDVPSSEKPNLSVKLPNMQIFNCPSNDIESCVSQFLQYLQQK
jgi:hypothetical protein